MSKNIRLLIIIFIAGFNTAIAQQLKLADGNGAMILRKYIEVEGSPFLTPNWGTGTVKLKNGDSYKDMQLKLDQVEQKLCFKNTDDATLYFADPVAEFKVYYIAEDKNHYQYFRTGYGNEPNYFYEVLADGSAQFLKLTLKSIKENRVYGSATTTKTIEENTNYYIFKDGKLIKLNRNKKAILAMLGTKTTELEAYIKSNNLNVKEDVDLAKLIIYYNSI